MKYRILRNLGNLLARKLEIAPYFENEVVVLEDDVARILMNRNLAEPADEAAAAKADSDK